MKTSRMKYIISITLASFFLATIILYAKENGITGRTLKTSTDGCSCHGSTPTSDVSVLINGPDTVNAGQTMQYSLSITKLSQTGAGLDIAVRRGTLSPVSNNIHLTNNELTHNYDIAMTNGTVTVQFNYIAPASVGIDTIWANGNTTNSNGHNNGDFWNWAVSKKVIIRNAASILSLKVLLEACSPASDTISVPLRTAVSPYTFIDIARGIINNSGNVTLNYPNVSNGVNYYIVINHRNSVETWSASGNSFIAGVLSYDFTTGLNKAFGNNMVLINGKANVFTGDVNQDGNVDLSDIIAIYNDASNFVSGYVPTDLNYDLFVDVTDLIAAYNNGVNFVGVIRP